MILKQIPSPTSALPSRPERPFKYVWPVTTHDGSVGYDRPLENYFDPSMAQRILPAVPSGRLYDTVARAHDFQYQVTPNMLDPAWSTPRPLNLSERHRSLAKVSGDSPDYMGISPDLPGWHPRRSPHQDRRGTVSVTPKEVNSLVPYIPPIDTSFPPPSKEWLDEMAKRILADAHADINDSHYNDPTSSTDSDDTFFDYDSDSTLDAATVPHSIPQPPQSESDPNAHDADFNSNTDTDTETDTDIDMESDNECDRNATHTSHSGPGTEWLIRRKRPSIINKNVTTHTRRRSARGDRYRRRGGKIGFPGGISKSHTNDTPARQRHKSTTTQHTCTERSSSLASARTSPPPGSDASCPPVSSITATALQMNNVRIASPGIASPPLAPQSSVPPRSPKLFPCLLDGCAQICASAGDLQRHQQSLRHRVPSYACLACGKSYTRSDALKRHLNSKASCKKEHAAKLIDNNVQGDQEAAEANDEAVQVVVTSSE